MFFERHRHHGPHDPHGPHGPRMAFAWGGPFGPEGEEAWQPWARDREGPGWFGPPFGPPFGPGLGRMMRHFARHFPFGPGMPPAGPRMFGRGHLKYALLDLLQERPKHGYEMIKELEEKSSGFYTPSAGAVYPTLQMLEDRDWVTSQTQDSKKVYTLTDAGRAALAEHKQHAETFGGPRGPWGERWGEHGPFGGPGGPFGRAARPELRELRHEAMEVARLMRAAVLASGGDPERLSRLRGIVERAHGELDAYLGQARPEHPAPPTPPTPPDAPAGSGPVEQV